MKREIEIYSASIKLASHSINTCYCKKVVSLNMDCCYMAHVYILLIAVSVFDVLNLQETLEVEGY